MLAFSLLVNPSGVGWPMTLTAVSKLLVVEQQEISPPGCRRISPADGRRSGAWHRLLDQTRHSLLVPLHPLSIPQLHAISHHSHPQSSLSSPWVAFPHRILPVFMIHGIRRRASRPGRARSLLFPAGHQPRPDKRGKRQRPASSWEPSGKPGSGQSQATSCLSVPPEVARASC
jgi:hypothetical protein